MLLLTRTVGTSIIIDNTIVVKILDIRGKHITIGIDAPREISITRDDPIKKVSEYD